MVVKMQNDHDWVLFIFMEAFIRTELLHTEINISFIIRRRFSVINILPQILEIV